MLSLPPFTHNQCMMQILVGKSCLCKQLIYGNENQTDQ